MDKKKIAAAVLFLLALGYYAHLQGWIDPGMVPVPIPGAHSEWAKKFDEKVSDNDCARFYGETFLELADILEADRDVITTTGKFEDFHAFACVQLKQAGGNISNPGLSTVLGQILKDFDGNDAEFTREERKAAVKAYRTIGNGLIESSKFDLPKD